MDDDGGAPEKNTLVTRYVLKILKEKNQVKPAKNPPKGRFLEVRFTNNKKTRISCYITSYEF